MNLKKPFFSRKSIVILATSILAVYILAWASVPVVRKLDQSSHARHAKAAKKKFDSQSEEVKASLRAQSYLKSTIELAQPSERLFLDYLQRKFKLDSKLGVEGSPFRVSEDKRIYPQEINYLYRIAYPNKLVDQLPKDKVEGPTLTNIFASNCDHLAIPANYWKTIEENYKQGGYYLTHNALAFALMKDNGCQIPGDRQELLEKTISSMDGIARNSATSADLRYEALAFLQLSGRYDLVSKDQVAQVAAEQNKDGSWGDASKSKPDVIAHTTILGLWVLLEYNQPNLPYEPIIHRPNSDD